MRYFKTALTVIGAVTVLVLAGNTVVYAATGGKFFLGQVNKADRQSTLKRTTSGPALGLVTKSASNAPLSTNGRGKVANLNADRLDGRDSSFFASGGYSASFEDNVTMTAAGESHVLLNIAVPSGKYVVVSRLQGQTGTDGGGNNFRYDCTLAGAAAVIDNPTYRVGMTNSVENYLTYQGVYSGAGPITLSCSSGNGHTLTALSGSLVATKVGS